MGQRNKVTLSSIAAELGVSTTTISRVLSGQAEKYRISKSTEEVVLRTATELGYVPDQLARGLRIKRTNTVGLIIPDISNPFFATVARNIEIEARRSGYLIILSDSQESTWVENETIRLLKSRRVDGFIICPVGEDSKNLEIIINDNLPVVIVDRYFSHLKCPFVVSDNYKGALQAVRYLIQMNHRNIACIQGRTNTSVNNERVQGFRDAHKEFDIPLDESLIVGDNFGKRNGYIWTKMILNRNPRPTAILALSNLISLGAIRAIIENGLTIPEDISIISFDEQPYSAYMGTPMTTIAQQTNEIGQIAFKVLISEINDRTHGEKASNARNGVILPTELIKRKSVIKLDPPGKEKERIRQKFVQG